MSKLTRTHSHLSSFLIGGLVVAATVLAATRLRKREDIEEDVEAVLRNCEQALARLVECVAANPA